MTWTMPVIAWCDAALKRGKGVQQQLVAPGYGYLR